MSDSDDRNIPKSRLRRSAGVGWRAGFEGARFAGAKAGGLVRGSDRQRDHMERVALDSADRMVDTLGSMKGAAMKMGQLASFIDTDYLPDEYRSLYQEKLGKLRTSSPPMPWEKVQKLIDEEYDEPCNGLFQSIEHEAFAAASIGQVHRAVLYDGRKVALKVQYPGVDAA
jgi:predicted unusual protein kinase regulating ubiquinone biosynthesis (AarF/ABC1/UbiB family)